MIMARNRCHSPRTGHDHGQKVTSASSASPPGCVGPAGTPWNPGSSAYWRS